MALVDNDPITSWTDKISTSSFTQGTGAQQPVYNTDVIVEDSFTSHDVATFDGSDRMTVASVIDDVDGDAGLTCIAVVVPNTLSGSQAIIARNASADRAFQFGFEGNKASFRIATGTGSHVTHTGTIVLVASTAYVITYKYDGTATGQELKIWVDSVADGSTSGPGVIGGTGGSDITLGARTSTGGFDYNGQTAEILIYKSALSDGDRGLVETALLAKYGL